MFNSANILCISGFGTGAPATMPVRRLGQDQSAGRGSDSNSSNIAGTPWSAVQFSTDSAERTAGAEKDGDGSTMDDPCVMQARRPSTRPKQWKRGGGQQRISEGVKDIRSPMERELLIRLLEVCQLAKGGKVECLEKRPTGELALLLWGHPSSHWCIAGCRHHGYAALVVLPQTLLLIYLSCILQSLLCILETLQSILSLLSHVPAR